MGQQTQWIIVIYVLFEPTDEVEQLTYQQTREVKGDKEIGRKLLKQPKTVEKGLNRSPFIVRHPPGGILASSRQG